MLPFLLALFGAALGGTIGSFLACARWRLRREVSLQGRSYCDSCGRSLPFYWNLPIVSWLLLRGRSRCCATPLPLSLLLWEVGCGAAGVAVIFLPLQFGSTTLTVLAGPLSLLGFGLLAAATVALLGRLQKG